MGAMVYKPEQTRRDLLLAAQQEIWHYGFRSASLERILRQAGVTKGALYHHFRSKSALGYAVVDEVVRDCIVEKWVVPLQNCEDPLAGLRSIPANFTPKEIGEYARFGCPLGSLAQEMSPIDEGFRHRIEALYRFWQQAVTDALLAGQRNRKVREGVDAAEAALFIIAVCEGIFNVAKACQDDRVVYPCFDLLSRYLDGLRP